MTTKLAGHLDRPRRKLAAGGAHGSPGGSTYHDLYKGRARDAASRTPAPKKQPVPLLCY